MPPISKPRLRRVDTLPAVPRERILLVAARLFREHGFQATTVRDIGREVGILSGSLFHHFPSKEQILIEMLREAAISMFTGAGVVLSPLTDPVLKLRALIRFEMGCFVGAQTRDYYAVLVSEWRDVPASVQPELTALRRRYFALTSGVLQACHSVGRLRLAPDAAEKVLHGVTTGAVAWFRNNGAYTADEFADLIFELLINDSD